MPHVIGCDAHKKCSVFVMVRVEPEREAYRSFRRRLPGHSGVRSRRVGSGTGGSTTWRPPATLAVGGTFTIEVDPADARTGDITVAVTNP